MKPASRAVTRLLRSLGIAEEVDRSGAVDAWIGVARSVLGPGAGGTQAIRIDGPEMIIAVADQALASEIRLRESELLAALRLVSPRSGISSLRAVPAHAKDRAKQRS